MDTAVGTAKSAAVGFAAGGAGSALKGVMQNSSSNVARNLSKTTVPAMAVGAVMDALKTLNRLRKGEIDGVQCLEELGQSATAKMSAAAFASYGAILGSALPGPGNLIGAVVGGIVGHALASRYYKETLGLLKEAKMAREERIRIEAECAAAKQMYQEYRAEFDRAFTRYMSECRQAFDLALRDMRDALEMGDADWFIASANRISGQMGREPQFETRAEFDALMESSEAFVL